MTKINIKRDTDQTVEIGECHIEVRLSTDQITEEGCNYGSDFRREYFRGVQNYRGQNFRGG